MRKVMCFPLRVVLLVKSNSFYSVVLSGDNFDSFKSGWIELGCVLSHMGQKSNQQKGKLSNRAVQNLLALSGNKD